MWMHLDDVSVEIPQQLLDKSEVLMDALSVAEPSVERNVTLAAPKEWLRAWVGCFCNEGESLSGKDISDLVNCLLVCFLRLERSCHRDPKSNSCRNCVHSLSPSRLDTSPLPDSMSLIFVPALLVSYERWLVCRSLHHATVPKTAA
jgi:hypothetical protein